MGTDIHMLVERRTPTGWELAADAPVYDVRNYNAFAILADVRNGHGFAGCDTGDGFVPIASPRGLPQDLGSHGRRAINEVLAETGDHLGDHSHSWLRLDELLAYNWNQRTNLRGVVSVSEFREYRASGAPNGWCGGVSGLDVVHVTNEQMDQILAGAPAPSQYTYTRIQWSVSYKEAAPDLHAGFIPELCGWAQRNDLRPDEVRIVFGFDS